MNRNSKARCAAAGGVRLTALVMAGAAVMAVPATAALAQGTPAAGTNAAQPAVVQPAVPGQAAPAVVPAPGTEAAPQRLVPGEIEVRRASRVIGADVLDAEGRKIGDIKDVVFDPNRGQVAYAVVGFGGLMGLGTRYYAIPWNVLHQPQPARPGDRFVINMTKEQMRNAPSFERNQWPDMASAAWHRDIARFYAQAPYWEGNAPAQARGTMGTMGGAGTGDAGTPPKGTGR